MKILKANWFTPMGNTLIGIVYGEDEVTKEKKAYIGIGNGYDEKEDSEHIAETGAKFPADVAEKL